MALDKRKFTRIDVPILMEFKPTKESAKFSWGLTRDFSCDGFGFESINFHHNQKDTLEFILRFPEKSTTVSVLGDVMWKKELDNKYMTGIRLKDMSDTVRGEFLKKISDYGDFPVGRFYYRDDFMRVVKDREEVQASAFSDIKPRKIEERLQKVGTSGIKRQYMETGYSSMVTFILPKEVAPEAESVTIVGDFNNWNKENIAMKKLKNGNFAVTLKLRTGREYRFRYLINNERWENDPHADRYEPNPFGWHDSVLIV
jgi:hypothetical protein